MMRVTPWFLLLVGPSALSQGVECYEAVELAEDFGNRYRVRFADMDGDGLQDLVSGGELGISWYRNLGGLPPVFSEQPVSSLRAVNVEVEDRDGDGDVDIFVHSEIPGQLSWLDNDGGSPPAFTERIVDTGLPSNGLDIALGDIDGDGLSDPVVSWDDDDAVFWYEGDGGLPPSFTRREIGFGATPQAVNVADLDGDGDVDVLANHDGQDAISWYENLAGSPPEFARHEIDSTTADTVLELLAADMDGDGDLDVLVGDGTHRVTLYDNEGGAPPTFSAGNVIGNPRTPVELAAGDLNDDGLIDLAVANSIDGIGNERSATILYNQGGSPLTFRDVTLADQDGESGQGVDLADADEDGDLDIVLGKKNNLLYVDHTTFAEPRLAFVQGPLVRGESTTFTVLGAEPDENVRYVYSVAGEGAGPCPPVLGGLCLDLLPLVRVLGEATAEADCFARLRFDVPLGAPFDSLSTQAAVVRGVGGEESTVSLPITAPIE